MSATTEPTTVLSVRVPESFAKQYDALAKATDRNKRYHLFEAVRRYIEAEAWQVELIAERKRQLDAGEIGYASPEHVAALRAKRYSDERAG